MKHMATKIASPDKPTTNVDSATNGIVIKTNAGRIGDGIAFLFMICIGGGLFYFGGGVMGWLFCALFALFSLLPLSSFVHPETWVLTIHKNELTWHGNVPGSEAVYVVVKINEITKVIRQKNSGYRKLTVVEMFLETRDGVFHELPHGLHLAANGKKIIDAILESNPSVVIEERMG